MQKLKSKNFISPLIVSVILFVIILNSPTFALYNIISPQATLTLPTTTFYPTITLTPTYTLTVKPTTVSVEPGKEVYVDLTVTSFFGYNKSVELFASKNPSGISIYFPQRSVTPPPNGNITTIAAITVKSGVAAGTYKMFINATDGVINRGVEIIVNVIQTTTTIIPTYNLSVTPTTLTIETGKTAKVQVTVISYFGYIKPVYLSSSKNPSGIYINFLENSLRPPPNSTINTLAYIAVDIGVAAGTYKMFINATDGVINRGVEIIVNVIQTTTTPTTTSTTPTTTTPSTTPTTSPTTTTPSTTSSPTTTSTAPSGGIDTTTIIIIAIILIAVFAAIAFFVLRKKPPPPPPPPAKRYCMHCGSGMPEDAVSCPKCGKQPAGGPDTKVCPNCGSVINIVAAFCPKCGAAQPKVSEKGGSAGG
ncbi:MAG: zinc ribbon domain-containing protein [Nitrososphaeria archaeon]